MNAALTPGYIFTTRSAIHDFFGGQRQGGISISFERRAILLFSNSSGGRLGYHDRWAANGSGFLYYGSGPLGKMKLERGNKAIAEHLEKGRELYLFQAMEGRRIKYSGQFCLDGIIDEEENVLSKFSAPQTIVFRLKSASEVYGPYIEDASDLSSIDFPASDSLRDAALAVAPGSLLSKASKRNIWMRSRVIREYCLSRAAGQCESCLASAPFQRLDGRPYLEVHHIGRLSDGGPDHIENVVAICPNCHRRAHFSEDRETFTSFLSNKILEKEKLLGQK